MGTNTVDGTVDASVDAVLDTVRNTREALSVGRAFGTPIEHEGATVIPVARIAGGAGGGGGEGTDEHESGRGFGTGFGLGAQPIGLYELRSGEIRWKPAIDVNRLLKGMQVLIGMFAVCATLVALRRDR